MNRKRNRQSASNKLGPKYITSHHTACVGRHRAGNRPEMDNSSPSQEYRRWSTAETGSRPHRACRRELGAKLHYTHQCMHEKQKEKKAKGICVLGGLCFGVGISCARLTEVMVAVVGGFARAGGGHGMGRSITFQHGCVTREKMVQIKPEPKNTRSAGPR